MKKIGIFINKELKKNAGGPSGYLYNLKIGLDKFDNNIEFFTINNTAEKNTEGIHKTIKYNPIYLDFRLAISYLFKGIKTKKRMNSDLYKMSCVHVHASEDLWALKAIIGYKGKIIFTPHRPETLANEVVTTQQLMNDTKYKFPILRYVCNFIERYSYRNANAFIFPSKGAAKIYEKFPGFMDNIANKEMRFFYTGTRDVNETARIDDYEQLREDGKTVFAYVGRHNFIKGYDLLVAAFPCIESNDAKIVCAGAQSNIEAPKSKNWMELGYINNANSLMKAADCVIIPNRNTYFDLIIIEALAVGAIVITSNTGGNVDLAGETNGLLLFESGKIDSLNEAILRFLNLTDNEKRNMKINNRNLYETKCSIDCFAKTYNSIVNELMESI